MKQTTRILSLVFALLLILSCFVACTKEVDPSLWDNATYTKDKTLGKGDTTLSFTVEMGDKSILLTIKTNASTVKDALDEHALIDGEQQSIGYMMSTLNGVRADWTLDGAYWAFYQNGEYMMTGIDQTPVNGDAAYEFVYTPAS